VAGRYVMKGTRRVGVQVAAYDPSRPLIVDPGLVYSTYLGGGGSLNFGLGIAVDGAGSAYVTGATNDAQFPTTPAAFQTTLATNDAFVTKLDATGSGLVYSTYLGGFGESAGHSIAVDGAGSAYVTGVTIATNFPTTAGAFQTTTSGFDFDAFVTKLDATGSGLVYSTYLGGRVPLDGAVDRSGDDSGTGIAVDGAGSAFVTGETTSSDFPTTAGAVQPTPGGGFVTKVDSTGSGLVYSTYLGGVLVRGIAVDGAGSVYVTGIGGAPISRRPRGPSRPSPAAVRTLL
jgi:Beta-propeller repeat